MTTDTDKKIREAKRLFGKARELLYSIEDESLYESVYEKLDEAARLSRVSIMILNGVLGKAEITNDAR